MVDSCSPVSINAKHLVLSTTICDLFALPINVTNGSRFCLIAEEWAVLAESAADPHIGVPAVPGEELPWDSSPWQFKGLGHCFNVWPTSPHCQDCRGFWFPQLKAVAVVCGPADFGGSLLFEPCSAHAPTLLLAWGFFLFLP